MEYTFTLKYQLPETVSDTDELVEKLVQAGCDDALIGLGIPGRIAMEFIREADSAQQAIYSAMQQTASVIADAVLFEVSPDYVGLTDVADLIGVSRQNMRKLMLAHHLTFPAPVHEGSTAFWHLADVLSWLEGRGSYRLPAGVQEAALVALSINLLNQKRRYRQE